MTFSPEIKSAVKTYASAHIADEQWHRNFFSFVRDTQLADRLGEEFIATRFIYKILEGIEADGWLLRAEVRNQIFAYASIYEAVLHHILFDLFPDDPKVISLTQFPTQKRISIPRTSQAQLEKHLSHDGKRIIPTVTAIGRVDRSKVRFDQKAKCAFELELIGEALQNDLIEFYEARNAIHIHAEIRKNVGYEIKLSLRAYRRMSIFKKQIAARLNSLGL